MSIASILQNVVTALLIGLITYLASIFAAHFFATDIYVGFQRTTLGGGNGYLFTLNNFDQHTIDALSITVDQSVHVKALSSDSIKPVDVANSAGSLVLTVQEVQPSKTTNVLLTTDDTIDANQIRASSNGSLLKLSNDNWIYRSFINVPLILSASFGALCYLVVVLHSDKKISEQTKDIERLQLKMDESEDRLNRQNDERQRQIDEQNGEFRETLQDMKEEVKRLEARAMKTRILLQKRIVDLTSENDLWRKFFVAAYTNAFGSKNEAEKIIQVFLNRNGIKPAKRISDFKEAEILEMLLDDKSLEKISNEL
jgi:hypothetical protein